jgi:hypothetical protein
MGKTMTKPAVKEQPNAPPAPDDEKPVERVGTWEEIQQHAELFAGKKVRVSVVPERGHRIRLEELTALPDDLSLAGAFKGKLGEFDSGLSDLSERTGERFTALMIEKHRKGHL